MLGYKEALSVVSKFKMLMFFLHCWLSAMPNAHNILLFVGSNVKVEYLLWNVEICRFCDFVERVESWVLSETLIVATRRDGIHNHVATLIIYHRIWRLCHVHALDMSVFLRSICFKTILIILKTSLKSEQKCPKKKENRSSV